MSSHRYSTAASHVILAGTGIYCVVRYTKYTDEISLPIITFGVIIAHSLLGVWKWGNPDYGDKVDSFFNITFRIRDALALSCIAGQMCIKAGQDKRLGYAHPVVSSIPLLMWLTEDGIRDDVVDGITALNIISCAVFAYLNDENWWGVGAAASYMIARYSRFAGHDIPDEDLTNFALSFFCYFAYRACAGVLAEI